MEELEFELPEEQIPVFEQHFEKAGGLAERIIILKGNPAIPFGFWNRRKASKAVKHYQICLEMVPNHWPSMWMMAKVLQVQRKHAEALGWFAKACRIETSNSNLPREASISAMKTGRMDLALEYSLEAYSRDKKDAGLACNHAVNLMVAGQDEKAMNWIRKAMKMDPHDEINQAASRMIREVASGKKRRPKFDEL